LRRLGKLEASINDFKDAIKMRPDRPSAHNNLGLSFFEYGEFDDALAHYKKAIELEPTSVHYNNRGLAYFHFDKLEEAKADFEQAISIDKKNPTIYFNLGNVYLNWKGKKKFDEAIKCYDTALRIQKDSAPAGN
jgi:tetratricopeptide (TPR) repeat protein